MWLMQCLSMPYKRILAYSRSHRVPPQASWSARKRCRLIWLTRSGTNVPIARKRSRHPARWPCTARYTRAKQSKSPFFYISIYLYILCRHSHSHTQTLQRLRSALVQSIFNLIDLSTREIHLDCSWRLGRRSFSDVVIIQKKKEPKYLNCLFIFLFVFLKISPSTRQNAWVRP